MYTFETEKGNVATSIISQHDAESKARLMDDANCIFCTDCVDCANCVQCRDCAECTGCTGCTKCKGCSYCEWCTRCTACRSCTECEDCTYCSHCRDCVACRDCSDCANWQGNRARNLLFVNAIPFPIPVSATHMQIGCINETHQWWQNASDEDVAAKGSVEVADVVEYRYKYGALIAAALEVRQ